MAKNVTKQIRKAEKTGKTKQLKDKLKKKAAVRAIDRAKKKK